ncbi:MAG TPA: alpha-L-fucosidase, partial [Tepidiformaceae bacterium]|nr:alpha-L-fucosidase [Tepidiformaceae bacterium]
PDFETPEQFIPLRPPEKRWEVCMTMNESWGYNPSDTAWKPARELVHTLCEVAGRGGNLLPNVCPMGDGRLPGEVTSRLDAIGRWMARNGESILGTSAGVEPWQFYGPSTRRGQITYLHLLMRPYQDFTLRGVPVKRVQSVHSLASGAPLQWTARTSILDQMFGKDPLGELRIALPESELDDFATVVAVEFQDNP